MTESVWQKYGGGGPKHVLLPNVEARVTLANGHVLHGRVERADERDIVLAPWGCTHRLTLALADIRAAAVAAVTFAEACAIARRQRRELEGDGHG